MLKKFLIIGLVFTFIGASALSWLSWRDAKWQKLRRLYIAKYSSASTNHMQEYDNWLQLPQDKRDKLIWDDSNNDISPEQLEKIRHERFIADIDKLHDLDPHFYPVANMMYGEDWPNKLHQQDSREEMERAFFAGSIICCSFGTAIILTSLTGIGIKKLTPKRGPYIINAKPQTKKQKELIAEDNETGEEEASEKIPLTGLLNCRPYSTDASPEITPDTPKEEEQPAVVTQKTDDNDDSAKNLYTDKESLESKEPKQTARVKLSEILGHKKNQGDSSANTCDSFFSSYRAVVQVKDDIDKTAKKFTKEAKVAKKIAEKQPDLLNDALSKLTEEVAAIRQYAGQQDDRVKKLQQGHDWNIIRNFGLRIIRCVDNLDRRINVLHKNGQPAQHLEEIRDELLFALESSGLERYEPQLRSDYRGQEKTAEAVKTKQQTDEPGMTGKIASVVRCGYKYIVDDENFKVVRAAQVKLFG